MLASLILAVVLSAPPDDTAPTPADKPTPSPPVCCAGKCVFPGACGQAACICKPVVGVVMPTTDQWRPFAANPVYEVWGHEVPETRDGRTVPVFRYSLHRLRAAAPSVAPQVQLPAGK